MIIWSLRSSHYEFSHIKREQFYYVNENNISACPSAQFDQKELFRSSLPENETVCN